MLPNVNYFYFTEKIIVEKLVNLTIKHNYIRFISSYLTGTTKYNPSKMMTDWMDLKTELSIPWDVDVSFISSLKSFGSCWTKLTFPFSFHLPLSCIQKLSWLFQSHHFISVESISFFKNKNPNRNIFNYIIDLNTFQRFGEWFRYLISKHS